MLFLCRGAVAAPSWAAFRLANGITRQWVIDAGFAVMMSEVRELGGEEHYWVMARKST
jgi:hypothetical protein